MESYKSDSQMEESSWTYYFQGFESNEEGFDDEDYSFSSELETPSLVSDAASSAVKKLAKDSKGFSTATNDGSGSGSPPSVANKQDTYKMQRALRAIDFDLEDTASSPITSPKEVSHKNHYHYFMDHKSESFEFEISTVKADFSSTNDVLGSHYWYMNKKTNRQY